MTWAPPRAVFVMGGRSMVERKYPDHIWAYDDGAHVMAFDFDNTNGGAVRYVRADLIATLEAQLTEEQRAVEMLVSWAAANNGEPDLLLTDWRTTKHQNEALENGIEELKALVTDQMAQLAERIAEAANIAFDAMFGITGAPIARAVQQKILALSALEATPTVPKMTEEALIAACQATSVNWTLSGEQILRLYRQVSALTAALSGKESGQ